MTYTLCTKNQRCGKLDGHEDGCSGECAPAEPSTAEAFEIIREALREPRLSMEQCPAQKMRHHFGLQGLDESLKALALLERRMQEMRAALQMVSKQVINSQWVEGGRRRDMQREVRKALGDV